MQRASESVPLIIGERGPPCFDGAAPQFKLLELALAAHVGRLREIRGLL